MNSSTPGLPVHHQLPEFTQTHVHRVGDTIQPSHPLLSPSLPAPNPSHHQGLFQWVRSSHEVAKYWSFSFSISPSNEHPGLISFRIDWLDLLAVQGTLIQLTSKYMWIFFFFFLLHLRICRTLIQWKHRLLTTGLPGNSLCGFSFPYSFSCYHEHNNTSY